MTIPAGVSPVDALRSTSILHGATSGNSFNNNSDSNFDDFGSINSSMDPELAMALRLSAEEARAREESKVFNSRYYCF